MSPLNDDREGETGSRPAEAAPARGALDGPALVGRAYWRSLNELAGSPGFRARFQREFPPQAEEPENLHSRRGFLQLMGASLCLAGLAGCRWPRQNILPFAHRPENRIPGVPQQYATAMELGGVAHGLLVTSYDGRPIKVEGNSIHPISGGAADARAQASVLGLYDPDRSQTPMRRQGDERFPATWDDFTAFSGAHFSALRARDGEGLAVLGEESSSLSLAEMRARFLRLFPRARWCEWEPVSRDRERAGARIAFGRPYRVQLDLERADLIVALDSDFLYEHPAAVRHAREFARGRRAEAGRMNRLYVLESAYSITGANADHRRAVPSSQVPILARQLAAEVLDSLGTHLPVGIAPVLAGLRGSGTGAGPPFIRDLARDLVRHAGRGVVVVGPRQPAEVHAIAHLVNQVLGNAGQTVQFTMEGEGGAPGDDPGRPAPPSQLESLRSLVEEMRAGRVDTLLLLGSNPVYDAPVDLGFGEALGRVPHGIHLGLYQDETAQRVLAGSGESWHIPRAHYLESWGDARSWDGTVSVVQPLIDPLYEGKTPIELLAAITGDSLQSGYDIVRRTLEPLAGSAGFEAFWRTAVQDGILAGTALARENPPLALDRLAGALSEPAPPVPAPGKDDLEIVFCPDASAYDGRFANNGWLQETPRPLSKLTWDNAILLGPCHRGCPGHPGGRPRHPEVSRARARDGGLRDAGTGALLCHRAPRVRPHGGGSGGQRGRVRRIPAADQRGPGLRSGSDPVPDRSPVPAGLHPGPPRHRHGGPARDRPARARPGARGDAWPSTGSIRDSRANGVSIPRWSRSGRSTKYEGHRWGMAIDLTACTGCNACVVACTAENNVPVVGKERVRRGREMQWIRVDRYFVGDPEEPAVAHQPVACAHCEMAPCEQVCPVAATMHDARGPERHGVQPLHRHPLLLQQLSLQGPAVQLLQLPQGPVAPTREDGLQPRGHGAQPRGHGEVHLLRAADRGGEDRGQERAQGPPRRRDRPGLRADLPDPGHRLRRPERSGQPGLPACRALPRSYARAGRAEHQAAHAYLARLRNPGEPRDQGLR